MESLVQIRDLLSLTPSTTTRTLVELKVQSRQFTATTHCGAEMKLKKIMTTSVNSCWQKQGIYFIVEQLSFGMYEMKHCGISVFFKCFSFWHSIPVWEPPPPPNENQKITMEPKLAFWLALCYINY